jgi:hypothetical protein
MPSPSPSEIEIILSEQSAIDLVRSINTLTAQYRKDYFLSDVYLYNGKGKVIFTKKQQLAA